MRTVLAALGATLLALGVGAAPALALNRALPAPKPGAEVYLRPADGTFDVVGAGFGHGSGMSQYGAEGAAQRGLSAEAILTHYYPSSRSVSRPTSTVDVGLTVDSDGIVEVSHRPGLQVAAGPTGALRPVPANYDRWRVRATSTTPHSCRLEGRAAGAWTPVTVTGISGCPVSFRSSEGTVDLVLPSGEVRLYRGTVTATSSGTDRLVTVNRVDREAYLRSVVSAEMPSWFLPAAHGAQAVAARTYVADRAARRTAAALYDVCDTTTCQVYKGYATRRSNGALTRHELVRPVEGVRSTADRVRVDSRGRLITAMYTSSNGGWMAGRTGFPYLASKADPYDAVAGNARHSWTAELPVTALERRFGLARLDRLQVTRRDGGGRWGGRVVGALVEGVDRSGAYRSVTTTGDEIRRAHDFPQAQRGMSSAYFTILRDAGTSGASRIAGEDRWDTAARLSARWPAGGDVVYLANGRSFPDALAAAARSGVNGGPVLITERDVLPAPVRRELQRLRPARVVVLGDQSAISNRVFSDAKALTRDHSAQRIGGRDRYETAALLASYYSAGTPVVYLATGERFPDALSVAALAAQQKAPLLITRGHVLPARTRAQLTRLRPQRVVVLGDSRSVSAAVARQAQQASGGSIERWGGANRYATAAEIARRTPTSAGVWVATGTDFPDALVGAARAGQEGSPMLLTDPRRVPAETAAVIRGRSARQIFVIGGTSSVSVQTYAALAGLLR